MFESFKKIDWEKPGLFAAGLAFGTAGIKLLSSKDAKKVYTSCTAAVLRAKECVMKTATTVQENAEDILCDAKQINEDRIALEEACACEESCESEEACECEKPCDCGEAADTESSCEAEA